AWKSPINGTMRITGTLSDCDPHDGTGVAWIIDHWSDTDRRELSSGEMPNGGTMQLDQGRTADRLTAIPVKAGDTIYLHIWLRQGDAHYDVTHVDFTFSRLDGPGKWDLMHDIADNLLEGNPHRDSLGNASVWHFYDMAGTHRRERMPAVESLVQKWKAAVNGRKPSDARKVAEHAAKELQKAIAPAGPDSGLIQALTGPRSPFWAHKRAHAKYLPREAQAALARMESDLQALRGRTPPLPCANGVQEGGLRLSLYPGFQDA